ncbi:glycine zipper family protein [Flectobacillus major]|uniref:glycine zipper family protein n=1 Tax=Flectobacillus major TaxID=103 RepID=UPI00040C1176|nr:glycine zipper family protein [Flectobacillus major]
MKKSLLLFCILLGGSSCSPILQGTKVKNLSNDFCSPAVFYDYSQIEHNHENTDQIDSILALHLSEHDRFISQAIGIAPYLSALYLPQTDTLKALVMQQKIDNRLTLTNIEIAAIAAELDCNGERFGQLADYVENINNQKNTRLTVASVALGALTTVATVLISDNSANTAVGVGGGLISAGLGALTIAPKGKKVQLSFQRNLLRNIWTGNNDNHDYPVSIWNILNERSLSNSGKITLRENIKKRWTEYKFENKVDQQEEHLFFDNGGIYSAEDLQKRANMLNELQATIRSINQDLRSLTIKLNMAK